MQFELLSACFCDAPVSDLVLVEATPETIKAILPDADVHPLKYPGQYCLVETEFGGYGEGDILMADAAIIAQGDIPSGEPCEERPLIVSATLAKTIDSRIIAVWGSDHGEANFGMAQFQHGTLQQVIVAESPEHLKVRAAYLLSEDNNEPEPHDPDYEQHYRWPEKTTMPGGGQETIDALLEAMGFNEDELIELTG